MLTKKRNTRKMRIRGKVKGTKDTPRLSVFRSNKSIYAQVINDEKNITLASSRGVDPKVVGAEIAKAAKKAKIENVVFDRSGYKYHGKVKLLADAAREGGLKF